MHALRFGGNGSLRSQSVYRIAYENIVLFTVYMCPINFQPEIRTSNSVYEIDFEV